MKYYIIYRYLSLRGNWILNCLDFRSILEARQWIFKNKDDFDIKDVVGPLKLVDNLQK